MSEAHTPSPGSRAHSDRPSVAAFGLTAAWRGATARRTRPSVFVGPDSIQRAIPSESRPTSSWTNRTAEHPAGLLIQSPGALSGVIEAGDILVEAEGQALGSFEQLLVTVKEAYERRAKRLSGRLFRRGDLVAVTVEPGW
jgi:S1-C subfamily serine protease